MTKLTYLLAGISLGIIVFQSAVVAPLVFTQLKNDTSGPFLRALFPRFFLILAGLSLAMSITSQLAGFTPGILLGGITLGFSLLAYAIIPATNRARDEARTPTFKRLHLASVLLTLAIGVLDGVTLFI
jgi:FtsH-binding integral membrane protein